MFEGRTAQRPVIIPGFGDIAGLMFLLSYIEHACIGWEAIDEDTSLHGMQFCSSSLIAIISHL